MLFQFFLPWAPWNEAWDLWEDEQVSESTIEELVNGVTESSNSQRTFDAITTYHVETAGCLAEDHEVRHSQWSCDGYKVFQHILFPNLAQKRKAQALLG